MNGTKEFFSGLGSIVSVATIVVMLLCIFTGGFALACLSVFGCFVTAILFLLGDRMGCAVLWLVNMGMWLYSASRMH